jgi:hypothetical protein
MTGCIVCGLPVEDDVEITVLTGGATAMFRLLITSASNTELLPDIRMPPATISSAPAPSIRAVLVAVIRA